MTIHDNSSPAVGHRPADWSQDPASLLPIDVERATLIGRVHTVEGPAVVTVRDGDVIDLTSTFATVHDVTEHPDPAAAVRAANGPRIGTLTAIVKATSGNDDDDAGVPRLLSPIDLHAVKAAGVTFAVSMVERVIEERCAGDPMRAAEMRSALSASAGVDLAAVRPGSLEAERIKETLVAQGAWSQYLEVGLGPDAEIFSKCPPMASVGTAVDIGVHPRSSWNNPEPEVVLAIASTGRVVGAALGNDVNLRDFEGRSALLLTKAKDNNASAAIGPFIRLFDGAFTMEDVRSTVVTLTVRGADGFELHGSSSMSQISRDPIELVNQLFGGTHQYPDGAVLYLGTMFAPVQDRGAAGQGFTHHVDDIVSISAPRLGTLVNRVQTSDQVSPWTFGTAQLMRNLAGRGLLSGSTTSRADEPGEVLEPLGRPA